MTIASQTMAPNSIMYVYELRYLSSLEDVQELRIFLPMLTSVRGTDDVRTFFEDAEEEIQIPAHEIPV